MLGWYLAPRKVKAPLPLSKVKSVLILRNDALGDAVVTTPVWRSLKKARPDIVIGVLASERNRDLLQADPDIDEVYITNSEGSLDKHTIAQIKHQSWDVTLCLKYNNKTKSALLAGKIAPDSITSTVAFNDDPRYDKMFSIVSRQQRVDGDHMTKIIRKHLQSVIDVSVLAADWHPNISIPDHTLIRVAELLKPIAHFTAGFIHVNLHASMPIREWSLKNVNEFCKQIRSQEADLAIVITGAPDRIESARAEINDSHQDGVLVLGSLDQLELCAVVRKARLVLTPDTALTHIASAERKPVVALHYRKNEWFPYNVPHRILYSKDERSVHDISVGEVLTSVQELLSSSSISN
jgi:ADP-heptose:LPS heptosyltransferase